MKLEKKFSELKKRKEKAFMAHVYCGDGGINFSEKLIRTLEKHIDILELGIPFSDPIADGSVFQQACQRALQNRTTPNDVFNLVKKLRKNNFKLPIVITTYYNIIFNIGAKEFVEKLKQLEVQGIIVPDLPLEESDGLCRQCRKRMIHLIYLVAPTTTNERMRKILKRASGFVYVVSVTGVTGTKKNLLESIRKTVKRIRAKTNVPLLAGFGIKSAQQIKELKGISIDGFILGSEICRRYRKDKLEKVGMFAEGIKKACERENTKIEHNQVQMRQRISKYAHEEAINVQRIRN